MPVVKNPFLSTDARGSLFGLTASFTRGGNIVKKKARPSTKYQPATNRVRSILGYLSRYWGELTDEQRDSWAAWAIDHPGTDKFGDPFIMSGFNAFIMLNHTGMRFFSSPGLHLLPPEDPPPASINILTAVTGATNPGDVDLDWNQFGAGLIGDLWEIQVAGPFQSPGRKSVEARFAYNMRVTGDILLATVAGLDEGMWYWFRARYVDQFGQITAWDVAQATPKLTV